MKNAEAINKNLFNVSENGGFLGFLFVHFDEFVNLYQSHLSEINHEVIEFHINDIIVVLIGLEVIAMELSEVKEVQVGSKNAK